MADKPRLLVIEREDPAGPSASEHLAEHYDVVPARTMARALVLLREQDFAGVYVDTAQLSAVRWAGVLVQADEILDAIADGVAVVDPDLRVIWANPEFHSLADPKVETIGGKFYRVLGDPEVLGPDPCPFTTAVAVAGAVGDRHADRRQPLPPRHRHAGLRRQERADAPDRPDPRDHRRDAPAAEDQRHPQGGRRAGRPDPRGTLGDGGRGADRPAEVQHRPAHEGPARPGLHRDPPARPPGRAGSSRS